LSQGCEHPALAALVRRMADRRRDGLHRSLRGVGPAGGPRVIVDGRQVLLMASNDYLGLSRHHRLARAASRAALAHGAGAGASRLISGTLDCHQQLERQIAAFKKTEAALFFCTGYMANVGCVAGLCGAGDFIVSDALNHASLIDACRLGRATVKVYPHADAAAAQALLAQAPAGALKLLITDGVFSMDGDLAPLPELLAVARRHGALLLVDDAHATGVWGAGGRGSLEHFGLAPESDIIQVGTLSKALGGLGGFVAGAAVVIDCLINLARPFVFSTAAPPAQVAAAAEALRVVEDEAHLRHKLHGLCALLRGLLEEGGLRLLSPAGPIIPILVGDAHRALAMGQALLAEGVFAPAIRPPTVPQGSSRIRLTVTAAHEEADMRFAARAVLRAAREVGLCP